MFLNLGLLEEVNEIFAYHCSYITEPAVEGQNALIKLFSNLKWAVELKMFQVMHYFKMDTKWSPPTFSDFYWVDISMLLKGQSSMESNVESYVSLMDEMLC